MDEGLQNAGISPKERLERIEAVLERIDGKLDNKADKSLVVGLESRIARIELEGCRPSQVNEHNITQVRTDFFAEQEKFRSRLYNLETVAANTSGGRDVAIRFVGWAIVTVGIAADIVLRLTA